MTIKLRLFLLSLGFFLLSGCSTVSLNAYSGSTLPMSESAVLTCMRAIEINAIDDNTNFTLYSRGGIWYKDCIISLEPGPHSILLRYDTGGGANLSTENVTLKFKVEKGNIYRIKYSIKNLKWSPRVVKLTGNELAKQRNRISDLMK